MDRIRGHDYVTIGGYRAFTDGPPGTTVNAQWLNLIQEEIMNVISSVGQLPNEEDDGQMLKAIRTLIRQYQPVYSVYDDFAGDMAATLTAVGSSPATILISTAITLAANTVIPATCTVLFMPPGIIYHGAFDLTISGQIIAAPNQQIISPSTGTVLFGDQPVYWDWFGTGYAGYNKAFAASRHVRLRSNGAYTIATATTAVTDNGVTLLGDGRYEKPRITYTPAAGSIMSFSGTNVTIGGFEIVGTAPGAESALALSGARARVKGLNVSTAYIGINVIADASLEDIYISTCTYGILAGTTAFENLTLRNVWIAPGATGGGQTGIYIRQLQNLSAVGLHIENADYGVRVATYLALANPYCRSCNLIGLHTENIALNELLSLADGTGAPYAMTRFNLIGGTLDGSAVNHTDMIKFGAAGTGRDTLTLMGTAVVMPGAYDYFIDDTNSSTNARVHLVNCYVPTKDTKFLRANIAKIVDLNEMTAGQTGILIPGQAIQWKESTLTYGVNVVVDASLGNSFYLNITDNVAFNIVNPTNGAEGQTIRFVLYKSAGGIHAGITWGADYKQSWASGDIAAPAAATPYSVISFTRRGVGVWVEESRCENQS